MSSAASRFKIPPNDEAHVLVLDDDEQYRDSLQKFLADQGMVVDAVSTPGEAERVLALNSYQVVIADIRFEGEGTQGDEFIIKNKPSMQSAKIIINTGFGIENIRHLEELRALGVTILEKGSHVDQLKDIVAETLANRAGQLDTKVSEQPDSSEEGYNEHFEAARDQVAHLYQQANYLLRYNKLSDAANLYREIIGILPNELEAYGKLRDVLERLGRTEEAKQVAMEFRERFPLDAATDAERVQASGVSSSGTSQESASTAATSSVQAAKHAAPASSASPAGLSYSQSSLRSLNLAEGMRRVWGHARIRRTGLLCGLLAESPESLASILLSSLGISQPDVLDLATRKLGNDPRATFDVADLIDSATSTDKPINAVSLSGLAFSQNAFDVLRAADSIAQALGDLEIEPQHLFAELMRSTEGAPGWIGWLLGKEKAEWIRRTLNEWPEGTAFAEDSVRQKALDAGLYSPASASSDAASKDDLLNFKQSASAMVNIVLKQDTLPPLVVGVYGPWGSGKSTYLELVKKGLLSEYDKIRKASDGSKAIKLLVVEYDAWAYSDAPKLWAGLITKIARRLDEDLGWWGRLRYLFKTHRARLVGGILLGLIPLILAVPAALLGLLKPLSAGIVSAAAGPLISVVSAWFAQRQAVYGNVRALASKFDSAPASGVINSIQDEFRDALESWIKQKTGADAADATIEQRVRDNNLKIVVFIDELDRCPLERIVDILEAIKLFLAKEIFIVFMAVDTRVASEAIRLHYKDVRNPDLPREYLEKIVQLPLRVPTARGRHLSAYLKKFMPNVKDDEPSDAQSNGSSDTASCEPSGAAQAAAPGGGIATAVPGSSPPVKPAGAQPSAPKATGIVAPKVRPKKFSDPSPAFLLPQLPDTKTELNLLATISEQFLESNPRKIKRLLNTYRYIKVLAHAQAEPVQSSEWQQTMLGWLAFTMTWPSFMAKTLEKVEDLEPKNEGVLLRAIVQLPAFGARPSEADVSAYLPVSGERIKALWELAGNFLIENADPGSVAHSGAQVDTRGKSPT